MAEHLTVEKRPAIGKRNNRTLRQQGRLPAVLYGHGEDPVSLALPSDELEASLRQGSKVVELKGAAQGKALLQEVQWDTFLQNVLHVDLLRIRAGEKVTVEVEVSIRGEAPGVNEGGVVEQLIHAVEIEVAAEEAPDRLHLNINQLGIGDELKATDIENMPPSAKLLTDPDTTIVQCVEPTVQEEMEEGEAGSAEPEVIGAKPDEEGEDSEG